jgi:hypothetical protein
VIVHTIGWTLIHKLSTIVNGGLDRQIGFGTMLGCGNGATPNRKGHMYTEKLKEKLNSCLDYLQERDSYVISFKRPNLMTIQINIDNSRAVHGTTSVSIENWGVSDAPQWNVYAQLGSVASSWADDGQLNEYLNYVQDIQYLVKSIHKAMEIK